MTDDQLYGPYKGMSAKELWRERETFFKSGKVPTDSNEVQRLWQWYWAIDNKDPTFRSQTPIVFYGKVEDQFGQPVGSGQSQTPATEDGGGNGRRTLMSLLTLARRVHGGAWPINMLFAYSTWVGNKPYSDAERRRTALLITLTLLIASSVSSRQLLDDETIMREQQERQRRKQEEYRELYYRLPKIDVCGRVVDQYGAPVAGATVTVEWKNADELRFKFSEMKGDTVKSDDQGNFKLRCNKPLHACASAEKDGYAPLSGEVCNLVRMHNLTLEAVPAVITLRKRGETTFLLSTDNGTTVWVWAYTNTVRRASLDLLARIADGPKPSVRHEDLIAGISYDAVGKRWTVSYSVAPGDGIICSNECLYEAPISGYSNTVSLLITNGTDKLVKYMYLRSRSPAIWSRIELDHDTSSDVNKGAFLRILPNEIRVNPYGERNLEYDDRFKKSWRAREELTKEAVTAITQGRFPEKCKDVPKRISEANKRR